jgi:anti-anti-sigma regulatory factor
MIKVTKEEKGSVIVMKLSGSIDETVNFDQALGVLQGEVHIHTKEIVRINSVGVKNWIKYFQQLQTKGVLIHFVECSTSIVEQINLISNFIAGGEVDSIYVPFACTGCNTELIALFRTIDLDRSDFKLPTLKCSKCSGTAVFDDIEDEYFAFLAR